MGILIEEPALVETGGMTTERVGELLGQAKGRRWCISIAGMNGGDDRLGDSRRWGDDGNLATCIRPCHGQDLETIHAIVNDSAMAYRGLLPAGQWHEPYMLRDELWAAIEGGVDFWGFEQGGVQVGVMGIQVVRGVVLIRLAYVRTVYRRQGIGGRLLRFIMSRTSTPILIGTWAAADWAVRFYQKHGFGLVTREEKERLLSKYWGLPARLAGASVVLGDARWFDEAGGRRRNTLVTGSIALRGKS